MKRKFFGFVCLLAIVAMVFSGCSSSKKNSSDFMKSDSISQEKQSMDETGGVSKDAKANQIPDTNRKLIRNVSLRMETREFDKISEQINTQIAKENGYIENSQVDGNKNVGYRNSRIVARIPKTKLDSFISSVSGFGNVISKQESVEDVTLKYVDVESHKKSLKIEQERLLSLLEKADKLEDIIALEKRLSEVRYELENYESQLRTYDNLIDYSTVTIEIDEVVRVTVAKDNSMWSKMGKGFNDSLYNIGVGLQNFAIWFVSNIIYIVIWLGIIFAGFLIIIKMYKKHKLQTPKIVSDVTNDETNDKENQ